MDPIKRLSRDWWLFLIALAIPGSVVFAWWVSQRTSYTFIEWISVIGVVGPMVLTLVLAFLYQGLKDIQNKQSEIMRYEQEPKVSLDRVDMLDYGATWGPPQFVFYLSNIGKGTAEGLEATISAKPIGGTNLEIEFVNNTEPLTRYGPEKKESEDYIPIKEEGGYLRPDEQDVPHYCPALIKYRVDGNTATDTIEEFPLEAGLRLDSSIGEVNDDTSTLDVPLPEYTITYENEDGRVSTLFTEEEVKRIIDEFDVEIQETVKTEIGEPVPDTRTIRERSDDLFDFDKIRIEVEIQYRGFQGNDVKNFKVLDRVVPIYYGLNSSTLFNCGLDYEDFESGSVWDSIEWNLLTSIARGETQDDSPGH